jgi:hypothetical protein
MRVADWQQMRDTWQDNAGKLRAHDHARDRQSKREDYEDAAAPDRTKNSPPAPA